MIVYILMFSQDEYDESHQFGATLDEQVAKDWVAQGYYYWTQSHILLKDSSLPSHCNCCSPATTHEEVA